MKTRVLSIAVMLGYALFGYGQNSLVPSMPKVLPPTPEATSLAKFTEVPVSKYTGTANVTIPFYTIKEGSATIPVGIRYHTRGIRVAEIASQVGLGWAFYYGGAISRQIRGEADESRYGYFNQMETWKGFLKNRSKRLEMIRAETVGGGSTFDYYPDKYIINTSSGMNTSFIYDYMDGKPVLKKYSDSKIETVYGKYGSSEPHIKGFKVTDSKGVVYYFGQSADGKRSKLSYEYPQVNYRETFLYNSGRKETPVTSERYISSWHLMEIQTPEGRGVKFFYTNDYNHSVYFRKGADYITKVKEGLKEYKTIASTFTKMIGMQHYLERIEFSDGSLHFERNDENDPRADLKGGVKLLRVLLKDRLGREVKRYKLNYSFTEGGDDNQSSYILGLGPEGKKRMFLDKIDVQKQLTTGSSAQIIDLQPPYKFKYNPMVLPSRYSTSQDAWGYFNNASNGCLMTFWNYRNQTTNRKFNEDALAAGCLEEIVYPTGGITKLKFEPNIVRSSYVNDNIVFPTNTGPDRVTGEVYGGGRRIVKIENWDSNGQLVGAKVYDYRDDKNILKGELLGLPDYELKSRFITASTGSLAGEFPIMIRHGNIPGSPLSTSQGNSVGYSEVTEYFGTKEANVGKLVSNHVLSFDSGTGYNFPYNFPNSHEWFRGALLKEATFKSYLDKGKLAYEKVKEVENRYQYAGMLNESGFKSYQKYFPLDRSDTDDLDPIYMYHKDRKSYRLPLIKFILSGDLQVLNFPADEMDSDVRHRLFTTEKDLKLVYYYKTFSFTGGAVDLMSSITRTYEDGQLMSVETNNFYDYENHYAVARTETTNSKGELVKSVFTYPEDGHPLKVQNRIQPIKVETFNKSSKLLTQQTNFDTFGSLYLAKEVKTGKGELGSTGGLETRLIYHGYDVKGNPTEVSQQDGIHITYLWGYDYTKPVAKIENASYAQVMTALGKQSTDNLEYLQTMNEAALQVVMTKLRANLPTAQVSSYTYIPLVGVSTITDPRGQKMTYHYDSFNRLQYVKDSQGNILKEHKYNYKN